MASVRRSGIDLLYWNVGCKEVDYVLRRDAEIAALEVKSVDADSVSGMHEFRRKYPNAKTYLMGVKLVHGNVGFVNNVLTVPQWCAFLLPRFFDELRRK